MRSEEAEASPRPRSPSQDGFLVSFKYEHVVVARTFACRPKRWMILPAVEQLLGVTIIERYRKDAAGHVDPLFSAVRTLGPFKVFLTTLPRLLS